MSFICDWSQEEFPDEETAYDDFMGRYWLYADEVCETFLEKVSAFELLEWATNQDGFYEKFGREYDDALYRAFEENYIEHEDDE